MPTAYTLADQQRMTAARNYFAWQGRMVTREIGRRVVEIGCGVGNFTGLLLGRDLVVALDIEPDCLERLRERYPGQRNLQTIVCDAGTAELEHLARFRPDSCVCLNVLEHIEDDRAALRRMASLLTPGGVVVLLLPAFPSLYGPIDRNLGHFRRYTRRSIRRLAVEAGLAVRRIRYMNTLGFFGWWANAHLFRRDEQSEAQIGFFDRYLVPPLSRLEALIPPPFGQSLFVVLSRG
jgi:SAM-dependent methyltransferase